MSLYMNLTLYWLLYQVLKLFLDFRNLLCKSIWRKISWSLPIIYDNQLFLSVLVVKILASNRTVLSKLQYFPSKSISCCMVCIHQYNLWVKCYCQSPGNDKTNSKDNMAYQKASGIKVPKIYWNLTRKAVLTMEWIDGIKLTDENRLREACLNRKKLIHEVKLPRSWWALFILVLITWVYVFH